MAIVQAPNEDIVAGLNENIVEGLKILLQVLMKKLLLKVFL